MSQPSTLLDALGEALSQAGQYNKDDQAAPAAILWPDKERQWAPLRPELRLRLPLLTLGEYDAAERTGPAPYIRCMLGRTLPDDRFPDNVVPIVYLPGVSRQELRAIEECPRWLQPLAELQYSGVLWTHKNGRDWTVAAFLQAADGGLGIPVAADAATREALLRALRVLAREPLSHLRSEAPLRAPFLDALLNPDEVRRLLLWMNDPEGYRTSTGQAEWTAFCNLCQHKYSLNPQTDGELAAAERLGQGKGSWAAVWQRFAEAPDAYPNLPELLRCARPGGKGGEQLALFEKATEYWPQDNQSVEAELREALLALKDRLPADSRAAIAKLEAKHGVRRSWVWARLGQAPLAASLEHLAKLAQLTRNTLAGANLQALAAAYTAGGWEADAAVLDALAAVASAEDVAAVKAAILPLYRSWLEKSATAFQAAVLKETAAYKAPLLPAAAGQSGSCIVFSDALRYDAAARLAARLQAAGFACTTRWTLAALPTVTSTAKPAISPVAGQFTGSPASLTPVVKATGAPVTAATLRKALAEAGYQVLAADECGDPSGRGWTEIGAIDQYGHGHGWKIAVHVRDELPILQERIVELLHAGWELVLVVTDHGWLMLPGGLPKVDLPQHLTVVRKGRCALMKPGAQGDQATVPWRWAPAAADATSAVAIAPGIACFEAGAEYEHGGLSPQECIVPVIEVTTTGLLMPAASIGQVTWKGLRCQIRLSGATAERRIDIRTKAADAGSSIVDKVKEAGPDGAASLLVPDEDRAGEAAFVVVLTPDGALAAQAHTTVGG